MTAEDLFIELFSEAFGEEKAGFLYSQYHGSHLHYEEESPQKYAEQYGWTVIDDSNRKDIMIRQMNRSYSYKPVLFKTVLLYADEKGRIKLDDIAAYFRFYYEGRREAGLPVEKQNSIFARGGYTNKEAERNIPANPFKHFEDMQMLRHTKTLGITQVDETCRLAYAKVRVKPLPGQSVEGSEPFAVRAAGISEYSGEKVLCEINPEFRNWPTVYFEVREGETGHLSGYAAVYAMRRLEKEGKLPLWAKRSAD